MDIVQSEFADHIGTITLNHKEKLNALSTELVEGVISALDEFRRGKARVVVLRAETGGESLVGRARCLGTAGEQARSTGLGRSAALADP